MSSTERADHAAIREVLSRYMRAMRLHDVDLMDDVFTADAVIDYTAIGGSKASWPDTKAWLQGMIDVEHFILFVGDVYPTFADDGESAAVESTWHGVFVATADAPPLVTFGTYADEFVRTVDGWRICARTDQPALQVVAATPPAI
jgi:SnoaL-like domain